MRGKSAHVKNEKQYEALQHKGMSKERAPKIANFRLKRHADRRNGGHCDESRADLPPPPAWVA